jgi:hypothetical protein
VIKIQDFLFSFQFSFILFFYIYKNWQIENRGVIYLLIIHLKCHMLVKICLFVWENKRYLLPLDLPKHRKHFPIYNWQRPWKTRIKSELFGVIQTNSLSLWWTTLLYYNEVYMGKCLRCFGRSSGSKYLLFSQTNKQIFTFTKYPYIKWQWIFDFLRRCFLSSITSRTLTWLDSMYG